MIPIDQASSIVFHAGVIKDRPQLTSPTRAVLMDARMIGRVGVGSKSGASNVEGSVVQYKMYASLVATLVGCFIPFHPFQSNVLLYLPPSIIGK